MHEKLIERCIDICKCSGKPKLLRLGNKDKSLGYTPAPDEMVLTSHRHLPVNPAPMTGCMPTWEIWQRNSRQLFSAEG